MPGLHSCWEFWRVLNETWGSANVDIHTLVRQLQDKVDRYNPQKSQDSRALTIGLIKSIQELNESVLKVASITRQDIRLL